MADIFLSYRRQDTQSATGRLADRLIEHFGESRVFRDHDSIVAGEDFAEAIRRAISSSTVVLAIIGPDWLSARDETGASRLRNPLDFVRLEIEAALELGVPVVPVLVEGTVMPPSHALPPSLEAFSRCQAVELSPTRWRYDVDRLIGTLQSRFAIESERPPLGDALPQTGAGGVAVRILLDLLELATHPTRLIARRQTGHTVDHIRAFAFLLACLVIGNLGLSMCVGALPLATWLAAGVLWGLITVTILAVPLTLAWRLAGTRVEFRQVTLILAYLYGGAWIGLCAGLMLIAVGLQIVKPDLFDLAAALMMKPVALDERIAQAREMIGGALQAPAQAALVIAAVAWLITAIWTFVAWGAFRESFGAGRLKSAAVTLLWIAMLLGLGWIAFL